MANKKISELDLVTPAGADQFEIIQSPFGSDSNKRVAVNTLGTKVGNISANQIVSAQVLNSFTNTSGSPLERGVTLNSFSLNWTYNRNSDNPTSQSIDQGVGSIAVGLRTKVFTTAGLIATTTFIITAVGDDSTNSSLSTTITFVYPYYYGVGAQGLTGAQVAALTKLVAVLGNKTESFSPTNQVPYFAYPNSYAGLTSILDVNGFETLPDWTLSTKTITGLDGSPQSYKVYEFNNLTTQTGFAYTFKY